MSAIEIRIELMRRGKTISGLAREWGFHRQQLSMCIRRVPGREYPALRRLLAAELGKPVGVVFAEGRKRSKAA